MFVTEANSGTIYTTGNKQRGIYKSKYTDGHFEIPIRLPDEINSKNWAGHPYIAPDESYIIFDSNVDEEGRTKNLFISFQRDTGNWSPAMNLTKHLKWPSGSCPHVTFDGRYLFFSSNGDIHWVRAEVIHELRSQQDF